MIVLYNSSGLSHLPFRLLLLPYTARTLLLNNTLLALGLDNDQKPTAHREKLSTPAVHCVASPGLSMHALAL